ncbi:hypothetical protein ACPF7Z_04450 [Halomonas sp. GXIMD04776]|uniref:hypothetical protein n=1 Tax=Halomonas sp. GXIMD04776 TaxID=3415605 RepID=UPI003C8AF830
MRQLDRGVGLTRAVAHRLSDERDPKRCVHRTEILVRQRILGLVLGYKISTIITSYATTSYCRSPSTRMTR